jgi:hypothetical protein
MNDFKLYAIKILFNEDKKPGLLKNISLDWTKYSEELIITVTLALFETVPTLLEENFKVNLICEIKRLELIGETLIEFLFMIFTITDPDKLN